MKVMKKSCNIWLLCLLACMVSGCSTDDADDAPNEYIGQESLNSTAIAISGMWSYDGEKVGKGTVYWQHNVSLNMIVPCEVLLDEWQKGCCEQGWVLAANGGLFAMSYSTVNTGYSSNAIYYTLETDAIVFEATDVNGRQLTLRATLETNPVCTMNEEARTLFLSFKVTAIEALNDDARRVVLNPSKALSFTGKY